MRHSESALRTAEPDPVAERAPGSEPRLRLVPGGEDAIADRAGARLPTPAPRAPLPTSASTQDPRPASRSGGAKRAAPLTPPERGTGSAQGPALEPEIVSKLAVFAFEAVDGTRAVSQLAAWISEEVAASLRARRRLRDERRRMYRDDRRAIPAVGSVHTCRVAPEAVEASIVLDVGARVAAVAMRLEHVRGQWRATSLDII